jgi:hypothetical protein
VPFLDARLPQRFWDKCIPEPNSGCWIWIGARSRLDDHGYGKIRVGQRALYAHCVAYEAIVGATSTELQLDHLCRNRCCVNPAHLEPVTQRVNIMRGESPTAVNASKTHCPMGHELTGPNLVPGRLRRGERKCRECKNEQGRRWMSARRAAVRA